MIVSTKKIKKAQCESCEFSFVWELMGDHSPRDSLSESSDEALGRSKGEISVYVILAKYMQSSKHPSRRLLLVRRY